MTEAHLVPPQSLEAEQAVLGALIRSPISYGEIESILRPHDFYNLNHRTIYHVIRELHEANRPVDITTIAEVLGNDLSKVGGRVYLVDLIESIASSAGVVEHAKIVRDKSILREMIQISDDTTRQCYTLEMSVGEIISQNSALTSSLLTVQRRSGFRRLSEVVVEVVSDMDAYTSGRKRGLTTGFSSLDELTGGFQRGDLIVLAGRPGTGKTAFSYNTASNGASDGVKVGYFSAETKGEDFVIRALCTGGKVNSMKWKTGTLEQAEHDIITKEHNKMANWPFWICDTPRIEIHSLIAQASYLKAKQDIDIIYVDYGQLITTRERYRDRREQMNYIIQKLKELAKLLNIPVVAISQLSRESVKHRNRPPMLSDLKETGAWEEDADLILALWKPTMTKKQEEARSAQVTQRKDEIVEALIMKQRNGPTGKVEFIFEKQFTRFTDTKAPGPEEGLPF